VPRARSLADQLELPALARQLELPALAEPDDLAPLPEPTPAAACARCGWLVLMTEEACPLCHARKDSPP
jgi:hypothetical protein